MAWHVYNDCHIQQANNTYNIHKWLPRRVIISLLFLYNFLALALVSPSIFQRNKNFLENRQNLNYEKIRVNIFFCSKVWNIDQEQVGESLSYFNYGNTSEESLSSWWILVTCTTLRRKKTHKWMTAMYIPKTCMRSILL